jgi:hypothetical protein
MHRSPENVTERIIREPHEVPIRHQSVVRHETKSDVNREASFRDSEFVPLLPEASFPSSQTVLLDPLQSRRPSPTGNDHRNLNAKSTRSLPDEIHITIGRIEVTAVPEPAARPAAKPARKQLSLDEYLKRADARRS